ncbi:hypothetical protein H2200_011486 [Cladophialophora chaetospira]|uniref:SRR1-like domain-containing protein n=1 Tax=Cladophialophora chaetospira TaxID=386627 RepID=A0AA39CD72_9EURO|nr:hypothetical protein H2200_011486 [Cladophialophora chaetospira]
MPSYLVTGANRGIGYGFVQYLAKDPGNTVIGIVRDKAAADKTVAADGFKNVTMIQAEVADRKSLLSARDKVAEITGGGLDYLINNAAFIDKTSMGKTLDDFEDDIETLEYALNESFKVNVVGVIHTINVFLPLIKKGSAKKVTLISSGAADPALVNSGIATDGPYSISKAAANLAIFKYNAKYQKEGYLFFALSPGVVKTWVGDAIPPIIADLEKNAPGWGGPLEPLESATMCVDVIHSFTAEKDGGSPPGAMPHTSHRNKKGKQNKRQEILDGDGWTRISSTGRLYKTTSDPITNGVVHGLGEVTDTFMNRLPPIRPMLAAKGSSLESMRAQYSKVEAIWLETELCRKLKQTLVERALTGADKISTCVLLGSGSFCGDAIHWMNRHEVAYFQLAALKTAVNTIETEQGRPVSAYAQEPYYNELDAELLASLDVTKVDHPRGFELLDECSFAYSPAAEIRIEQMVLARMPQIWLHRQFNPWLRPDTEPSSELQDPFIKTHDYSDLPHAALRGFPFQNSVIWWKKHDDAEDT